MERRLFYTVALFNLCLQGCNTLDIQGPVEIRVENGSDRPFDKGALYVPMDSIPFTSLGPGESTPYREVERAYRIVSVFLVVGTDTMGLQVIDFEGEKPLEEGRYTYRLSLFGEDPGSLTLELRKDG